LLCSGFDQVGDCVKLAHRFVPLVALKDARPKRPGFVVRLIVSGGT